LYRLGDCEAVQNQVTAARALYEEAAELWIAIDLEPLVQQIISPRLDKLNKPEK